MSLRKLDFPAVLAGARIATFAGLALPLRYSDEPGRK